MAVVINETSNNFPVAPDGLYLAVLADAVDLGMQQTQFGLKRRVKLVWLLDAYDEETGEQHSIHSYFNGSLHENATLRKELIEILGYDPVVNGSFDLDELIGFVAQVMVRQTTAASGKVYANIKAYLPANGATFSIPDDFIRQVDKDGTGTDANPKTAVAKTQAPTQLKAGQQRRVAPPAQQRPAVQRPIAGVGRIATGVAPQRAQQVQQPAVEQPTAPVAVSTVSGPDAAKAAAARRAARATAQNVLQANNAVAAATAQVAPMQNVSAPAPISDEDIPF